MKDVIHSAGDVATSFGGRSARLARNIGPVRALIGLAIIGAAVGGSIFLVRYLRTRKAMVPSDVQPNSDQTDTKHKPMHVHASH